MATLVGDRLAGCIGFTHCFALIAGVAPEGTLCLCGETTLGYRFEAPALWLVTRGVPIPVDR